MASGRKEPVWRREALDFNRVTRRVTKKHRPLLARLARVAHVGWQHKFDLCGLQPLRQGLPVGQRQHQAKVRHGDQSVAHAAGVGRFEGLAQVHGELVIKEVEIDPSGGAAAFGAAQHLAIKAAGLVEIGDMEGEVKAVVHAFRIAGPALSAGGAADPILSFPGKGYSALHQVLRAGGLREGRRHSQCNDHRCRLQCA